MSSTSSRPAGKPPFFIIGAQRSGTTYLYELLDGHPGVAMAKPKRPEPKWFLDPAKAALGREAWEAGLFPGVSGKVLGEKGTSYIEHPEAADAILSVFPEARFVVIVREPASRAVSNYRFSAANGFETLPLERALTPEAENRPYDRSRISASPFIYLKRSRYADYLEAWSRRVPEGRIKVVVFEELLREKSLDGLCAFLGVDRYQPKDMDRIVNAATEPMPEIPESLRKNLADYFREPNRRLEKFLGRTSPLWGA